MSLIQAEYKPKHQKDTKSEQRSKIPLYWLVHRDSYDGLLLQSPKTSRENNRCDVNLHQLEPPKNSNPVAPQKNGHFPI